MHDSANVIADVQHEFGHRLGFGQAEPQYCTGSLMGDPDGITLDFSSCDLDTMFTENFGQVWVDVDSDNFSATVDDCNDDNPLVYPGAIDTNPYCSFPDSMNPSADYNCNNIPDYQELATACPGQQSPILIDVVGNGFRLTDRDGGVRFDLNADGVAEQLPWTAPGVDESWLAIDRNANGLVDNGTELFGNFSPQPPSSNPNGFLALRVYDSPSEGGNGDGWIDSRDAIFGQLRLWKDVNHNGVSEPEELVWVDGSGVRGLSLDYRESRRVDQVGNWFRYGARVIDNKQRDIGPMAFDVFLGGVPPPAAGAGAGRASRR
jgi:hypothetical protein